MKRLITIVMFSFLGLAVLSTGCGPAEWSEASLSGHGYTVHFKMPKPFTRTQGSLDSGTGRTLFESGYVTEGDEDHKFQVRVMELPVSAWKMDAIGPYEIVTLALNRENGGIDKMLDVKPLTDPNWPENVKSAEEFMIVSGDKKIIRHTRILVYESQGRENYGCYVLLTASRPVDEARSHDVDRFFESLKICTDDNKPGGC